MNYKKSLVLAAIYVLVTSTLYWFNIVSFDHISPLWVSSFAIAVQTIVYLTYIKEVISKDNIDKFLGLAMFLILLMSGFDYVDDFLVVGLIVVLLSPLIQIIHEKLS